MSTEPVDLAESIRRLDILATFFEGFDATHKPGQFHMGTYGEISRSCGTTACVAGWAGLIPEFQALGLMTDLDLGHVIWSGEDPTYPITSSRTVGNFLGLSGDEMYLFYHDPWSALDAAGEIRKFIEVRRLQLSSGNQS